MSLDARGGCHELFGRNGWKGVGGLFLKKCFNLFDLSKSEAARSKLGGLCLLLGIKFKPKLSNLFSCCVSVFDVRFVM